MTAWFAWCNGVACTRKQPEDEISLVPGRWPLSMPEARSIIDDCSESLCLPGRWVPLLEDGGGDVHAAFWRPGEDDARIVNVRLDDSTDVVFPSIGEVVAYFNSCFEHGACFVDDDGRLSRPVPVRRPPPADTLRCGSPAAYFLLLSSAVARPLAWLPWQLADPIPMRLARAEAR